jgi:transcription elongation factor Elf1
MLSRSSTASAPMRAQAMRRLRRRSAAAHPLFCSTNGCATMLRLDSSTGVATCPICGLNRRVN